MNIELKDYFDRDIVLDTYFKYDKKNKKYYISTMIPTINYGDIPFGLNADSEDEAILTFKELFIESDIIAFKNNDNVDYYVESILTEDELNSLIEKYKE